MSGLSDKLVEITDGNFEALVLKSSTPFLLDLSAEWCGPCKAMLPVIEQLAAEYSGKVGFGSIDIDKNPKVPTQFQVRSIPTLLLFRDGKVVEAFVGNMPKQALVSKLSPHLG